MLLIPNSQRWSRKNRDQWNRRPLRDQEERGRSHYSHLTTARGQLRAQSMLSQSCTQSEPLTEKGPDNLFHSGFSAAATQPPYLQTFLKKREGWRLDKSQTG